MKTTSGGRQKPLTHRDDVIRRIQANPDHARYYLDACIEEGHGAFQVGLRDVIEAFGGMTKVSRKTALNREALYRTLSRRGNPRQDTLEKILGALGMRLSVTDLPRRKVAGRRAG